MHTHACTRCHRYLAAGTTAIDGTVECPRAHPHGGRQHTPARIG